MERGNFFVMLCTQGGGYAADGRGRHCEVRDGRGGKGMRTGTCSATTSGFEVYEAWRRLGL